MARPHSFTTFATPIGECALAWNDVGLTGVWLPARSREALVVSVRRRGGEVAPRPADGAIADVVEAIARLLAGDHVALDAAPLDLAGTDDFDRRVYAVARTIAAGRVLTYGDVAARVGADASPRDVGQALGRNRWPLVVPCHRIVASGHALGGFSAPGGSATKQRLLAIERARRDGAADLFDAA